MWLTLAALFTLMTAATNDRVRLAASLAGANLGAMWLHAAGHEDRAKALEAMMGSLTAIQRGATGQGLVAEMREHQREWDLAARAADFKGKPILLVAGSRDDDIPPAFHHAPLVRALEVAGTRTSVLELDADHMFADKRIALARGLLGWLLAHL